MIIDWRIYDYYALIVIHKLKHLQVKINNIFKAHTAISYLLMKIYKFLVIVYIINNNEPSYMHYWCNGNIGAFQASVVGSSPI